MSEDQETIVVTTPSEVSETKKRKADPIILTDAKRQQLADAREKKLQKATEKAKELAEMRSKLSDVENKLKESHQKISDVEQKVVNSEVDKEIKAEIQSPEKKQKVVTADTQEIPKPKKGMFDEFLNPENLIRTGALVTAAAASFYFKNVWRKEPPPPPSQPTSHATNSTRQNKPLPPVPMTNNFPKIHQPLSSLFK
jgi:seryl-tRNA synthetase